MNETVINRLLKRYLSNEISQDTLFIAIARGLDKNTERLFETLPGGSFRQFLSWLQLMCSGQYRVSVGGVGELFTLEELRSMRDWLNTRIEESKIEKQIGDGVDETS
jgi:hypothetical protein